MPLTRLVAADATRHGQTEILHTGRAALLAVGFQRAETGSGGDTGLGRFDRLGFGVIEALSPSRTLVFLQPVSCWHSSPSHAERCAQVSCAIPKVGEFPSVRGGDDRCPPGFDRPLRRRAVGVEDSLPAFEVDDDRPHSGRRGGGTFDGPAGGGEGVFRAGPGVPLPVRT